MNERKIEHPILFSTPMVQAILEGKKIMTRRVIKNKFFLKYPKARFYEKSSDLLKDVEVRFHGKKVDPKTVTLFEDVSTGFMFGVKCPYGKVGDRLWVRESWCNISKAEVAPEYVFKADTLDAEDYDPTEWRWKPSIHMPKAAARIWLEITGIRVERLWDITEAEAKAEGAEFQLWRTLNNTDTTSYKNGFTSLWLHINGDDSWNANPWVWVVEFKRIEK